MNRSESLDKIAPAIVELQAEAHNVAATAKNDFIGSKYTPLPELLNYLKPVLHKHRLAIVQLPAGTGRVGLETVVMHESGQWISAELSLDFEKEKGKSLAQVAGSYISYLRRYALGAVVGVATDPDLDGNVPVEQKPSAPTNGLDAKIKEIRAHAAWLYKHQIIDESTGKEVMQRAMEAEGLDELEAIASELKSMEGGEGW